MRKSKLSLFKVTQLVSQVSDPRTHVSWLGSRCLPGSQPHDVSHPPEVDAFSWGISPSVNRQRTETRGQLQQVFEMTQANPRPYRRATEAQSWEAMELPEVTQAVTEPRCLHSSGLASFPHCPQPAGLILLSCPFPSKGDSR